MFTNECDSRIPILTCYLKIRDFLENIKSSYSSSSEDNTKDINKKGQEKNDYR